MKARAAVLVALALLPLAWGQVQLVNVVDDGVEPVAGLFEGAAATVRASQLTPVSPRGRLQFDPGGKFAVAYAEVSVNYQVARLLDPTRLHRPSRYFVTAWVTFKAKADVTHLYLARGWAAEGGLRHVLVRPVAALENDGKIVVTDRFEIDDDELEGSLRVHVFRGSEEIPQVSSSRGKVDPRVVFSLAQVGNLAGLRALVPADVRQAIRAFKAEQVNAIVRTGRVDVLDFLVASGLSLRGRDESKRTALYAAAETGRAGLVDRLLRAGVPIEGTAVDDSTPLMAAARLGQTEVVRALLSHGARTNKADHWDTSVMELAAEGGHAEIVDLLLAAGAKWPGKPEQRAQLLARSIRRGHLDLVERLLATGLDPKGDNHGVVPLLVAVDAMQPAIVGRLLERGADPNHPGNKGVSALMSAAARDRLDLLHLLVNAGAQVDHADDAGRTALVVAWESNSLKAIDLLEKCGASTAPLATHGSTALTKAIVRRDVVSARRLSALGAKLLRHQPAEDSVLAYAIASGLDSVVVDALAGGWSLDEELLGGWSIAGIAQRYGQTELLAALRRANGGVEPPVRAMRVNAAAADDPLLPERRVPPRYPATLVAEKATGTATVEAFVNPKGGIVLPRVVQADRPEFGEAAVRAAFGWSFMRSALKPPVWRRVEIPFVFKNPELQHIRKFQLHELDQLPQALKQEGPAAPAGLEGRMDLAFAEMLIDDTGGVYSVKVMAVTEPRWRQPVQEALQKWEFRPGMVADRTVWSRYRIFLVLPEGRSLTGGSASAALEPVDRDVRLPRIKQAVQPELPKELLRDTVTHIALVSFAISSDGRPGKIRVLACSSPQIEHAVREAAAKWWFEPGAKDGRYLRTDLIVPFVLQPPGAPPL